MEKDRSKRTENKEKGSVKAENPKFVCWDCQRHATNAAMPLSFSPKSFSFRTRAACCIIAASGRGSSRPSMRHWRSGEEKEVTAIVDMVYFIFDQIK